MVLVSVNIPYPGNLTAYYFKNIIFISPEVTSYVEYRQKRARRHFWSSVSVSPSPSAHCCAGITVGGALRSTAHSSPIFILGFVSFSSSALFCSLGRCHCLNSHGCLFSLFSFRFYRATITKKPQRNDTPPTPKYHLFIHSCKFVQTLVQTVCSHC